MCLCCSLATSAELTVIPRVEHPDVSIVSFTGGTSTGKLVASLATQSFKKLSLELGGKNASIVFDDCDLDDAVKGVTRAAFLNSGQICLCCSRIFVQRGIYKQFIERVVNETKKVSRSASSLNSCCHLNIELVFSDQSW